MTTNKPLPTLLLSRGLMRGPARANRSLALAEVDSHRNLKCTYYDKCLNGVITLDWPGWSCKDCQEGKDRGWK